MKNLRKDQRIKIVILGLLIVFIFAQSCLPQNLSAQESSRVLQWLRSIIGLDILNEHLIRKLAHFTEYSALGFQLWLVGQSFNECNVLKSLNYGLIIAVLDESLQYFTARGSSLQDVWLDCSGVLFGICVIYSLFKIGKKI